MAINYKSEDWVERVKHETGGKGADIILDVMGAPYLSKNTESLAPDGRLIVLGLQGGGVSGLDWKESAKHCYLLDHLCLEHHKFKF